MQWILEQHGVKPMLHYLDDFLVIGTRTGIGNSTRVLQETGDPRISAQDRET